MSPTAITMAHRQMLDPLRSGEWKQASKLPIQISARSLDQMVANGWLERRDEGSNVEIRLTAVGLQILKAPLRPYR
jgi:hypothetical protein